MFCCWVERQRNYLSFHHSISLLLAFRSLFFIYLFYVCVCVFVCRQGCTWGTPQHMHVCWLFFLFIFVCVCVCVSLSHSAVLSGDAHSCFFVYFLCVFCAYMCSACSCALFRVPPLSLSLINTIVRIFLFCFLPFFLVCVYVCIVSILQPCPAKNKANLSSLLISSLLCVLKFLVYEIQVTRAMLFFFFAVSVSA